MSAAIAREGAYSSELAVDLQHQTMSFGFWEGKQFLGRSNVHCIRSISPAKSYINMTSRLLSAVSGDATVFCCDGSSTHFLKVFNRSPGRKAAV